MAMLNAMKGAAKAAWRWMKVAAHTLRYLWVVRAAIPWYVKLILGLAIAIKCLPIDFGIDEALSLVGAFILQWRRPGLLRACWQAARIRA